MHFVEPLLEEVCRSRRSAHSSRKALLVMFLLGLAATELLFRLPWTRRAAVEPSVAMMSSLSASARSTLRRPSGGYLLLPHAQLRRPPARHVAGVFPWSQGDSKSDAKDLEYEVVKSMNNYELRKYPRFTATATKYTNRATGIGTIKAYVDGANVADKKFSIFDPLLTRYTQVSGKFDRMMELPLDPEITDAPEPTTMTGELTVSGDEIVAVRDYEGVIDAKATPAFWKEMLADLDADGVKVVNRDEFRLALYGDLDYTPSMWTVDKRRKELWITVEAPA
eukprot:gnl/TRDRNA2_/TRDRNA2_38948_c0_seq1.p1 gnl/TRDRNA2_/TRDRNA2_38948_c0~~gnl/TRDRNA2_/TRDRNA2_38948_c0_seq1.p1  ORF type:complete len:295 (+),score=39.35 gnl/TRDRNA2_/TRDRNA2_38948_c0_seq1:47-886(+)